MSTNRIVLYRSLVTIGAISGSVFTGCASSVPASGFLSDYAHMERVENTAPIWDYVDRGTGVEKMQIEIWADRRNLDALDNYDRVLLDPLVFELTRGPTVERVGADRVERIVATEREQLTQMLGDRHVVVDQPGEGVVRIRRAVTKLRPQRAYDPPDRDKLPQKAFMNSRPGVVTTELEMVDSLTGERIAAAVIRARGNYRDTEAPEGIYEQPKSLVRCTGALLRFFLDRAHGIAPDSTSTETNGPKGN